MKAKLSYDELDFLFTRGFALDQHQEIKNTPLQRKLKELTMMAYPDTYAEDYTCWDHFYLPLNYFGKTITLPFAVREDVKGFISIFIDNNVLNRVLTICPGREKLEHDYHILAEEALKFAVLLKQEGLPALKVPYPMRTGKIKGKHIYPPVSQSSLEKLVRKYQKQVLEVPGTKEINLDDYLTAAVVCYRAVLGKQTKGLTPLEMYERWADGRHMGMLSLRRNSKRKFAEWYHSSEIQGGHPFEIIFNHMYLYPPDSYSPYYRLGLGRTPDPHIYVHLIQELMKNYIPFRLKNLDETILLLSGEKELGVNRDEESSFHYYGSREDYQKFFHKIRWDPLQLPKWR